MKASNCRDHKTEPLLFWDVDRSLMDYYYGEIQPGLLVLCAALKLMPN